MRIVKIGSGRYADCFRVSNGRATVIVKLGFYRENTLKDFAKYLSAGQMDEARRVKNNDAIQIANGYGILSNKLVQQHISPHFVFVYANIDGKNMADKFASLIPERMRSSSPIQLKYNNLSFLEPFDMDLTQWLRKARNVNDATVRGAIFGVLYTLAALQSTYPQFRHNDLSTNNVLVKKCKSPTTYNYRAGPMRFSVTTPILVGLSDYDFVHIPRILQNERVESGKYRVTSRKNNSYDPHFFLKTVGRVTNGKNLPETDAFLKSLPFAKEDRVDAREIVGMDPLSLLQHPYFASVRRTRLPKSNAVVYGFS